MKILSTLAWQFFILSFLAVGGVSATLPEMHRVFVDTLHLMNDSDFSHLFALSQAAPGPNLLFVGLFGLQIAGLPGALVSLLALCVPTLLMALAVERYGARYHDHRIYVALRRSLAPISIGLLISTALLLVQSSPKLISIFLTLAAILAQIKFRLHPLLLIAIGATLGALTLSG